ncbi:hypothetical protein ABI_09460 [Asticcacaulis biprosthecium C19]|uniref:Uncharacterized protein n=1 Tax=Asticcacaulis biprosthecium C19 TaxID=715226 RepID=F4QGQ7_9CAUL|nr:hypothetical protein [Asticcacaulis biprosthecium]EGF92509.1 hypothetical protein ABI_09460 [Asticcacaulis biprosthecium C19]
MKFSLKSGMLGGQLGGGGWQYVIIMLLPLAITLYAQWSMQAQLQQMQDQILNPQQFQQQQGYYQQPGYQE